MPLRLQLNCYAINTVFVCTRNFGVKKKSSNKKAQPKLWNDKNV